jgi:signal peptide peptidase SppA
MENHMSLLVRLASRIANTPLMIAAHKLDAILKAIGPRIGLATEADSELLDEALAKPARTRAMPGGDLAVIPVYDTLVQRAGGARPISGVTTYEQIRAALRAALADPNVQAIVFDIDSPGGESAGLFDLVDEIRAARKTKPIYAVANEEAYSAAYAIASAAEKVYTPRTGGLGSIGVIAVHVDESAAEEQAGLKYTTIFAGARKNDFSPHEPLSADARAIAQTHVDDVYGIFASTVARNRNMPVQKVRATEAGIYRGKGAVDAGLADEVASWDEAIQRIATDLKKKGGIAGMAEEKKVNAAAPEASPEQPPATAEKKEAAPAAAVTEQAVVTALDVGEAKAEAKREAIRDFKEIREVCEPFVRRGLISADFAGKLVEEGLSVDQARARVLTSLAEKSESEPIRSMVSALGTGEASPLIADAERRRAAAAARQSQGARG